MIDSMEAANEKMFLIRGTVEDEKEEELKSLPNVLKDPIACFFLETDVFNSTESDY
jgi:hypothetical protein